MMTRWIRCTLVGQMSRTGEHIVIKPSGDAARCRTVFRVPVEDRWDAEAVLSIRATPRRPTPSSDDGEIRALLFEEDGVETERRNLRREIVEQRAAAHRDPEFGAGLPRPEMNNRLDPPDSRRFRITDRVLLKY